MKENFQQSLKLVLVHEGGWSDNPADPGGATMKGVTLEVFRSYYGSNKTKSDLRNITDEQLAHIYKTGYWDKCKCDQLPSGVDYAVFDAAVNSGPGRSAKWLQGAVEVAQDGSIGAGTLAAVAKHDPKTIINNMLDQRLRFLQSLNTWNTFGKGWKQRVDGVRSQALLMAGNQDDQGGEAPQGGQQDEQGSLIPDTGFNVVRRGSTGEWVTKLQTALGINADGHFGAQTEAALKAFQEANGLVADGIAGRATYRALGLIK